MNPATNLLGKLLCILETCRNHFVAEKNVSFALYTGIGLCVTVCLMTLQRGYKADCSMKQKPGQRGLCKNLMKSSVLHCRGKSAGAKVQKKKKKFSPKAFHLSKKDIFYET